ncbi:hypothetical protein Q1695_013733 [Nippostrongylus brasiliensis]|nr:hypothetical protein Q1695_013733 [Nippostrongylus brasiliensis]
MSHVGSNTLSSVFRSLQDSCLASERVQDSSTKLVELDLRRQKIREASRLLRNPRQVIEIIVIQIKGFFYRCCSYLVHLILFTFWERTTWMALTESLMMEFSTSESQKILQESMRKTEEDYSMVNKQAREELNNVLRAKSSKDLESRGFTLKPINK